MHDGALIVASLERPECFSGLFDRHGAAVLRYAAARVGRDAAEDVAADTFLAAFERRARFDAERDDARPWLLGIATNLIRHRWREHARAAEAVLRLPAEDAPDRTDGVGERVDAERAVAALADRVRRLRPADRDALLLLAWGGLRYEEIAEATGVPIGTVRSRLHRARRLLRAEVQEEVRGGPAGLAAPSP